MEENLQFTKFFLFKKINLKNNLLIVMDIKKKIKIRSNSIQRE